MYNKSIYIYVIHIHTYDSLYLFSYMGGVDHSCIRDLGPGTIALVIIGAPTIFKSLRLRPPTPEAYGKTADVGTLCIPGSSQRRDPSAALLSSSDRSRLAALNVMLTPCPVP